MQTIRKYLSKIGLAVGLLYFAGFSMAPALAGAVTTPVKVMPLGDSITDGFVVPGGYRTQLWTRTVQTDGDNIDYVGSLNSGPTTLGDKDHEGHVGWCIDGLPCGKANDMVAFIDSWMSAAQPDIILLHGGTNDINDGFTGAQTATHLDTLLGKIYADKPSVDVIVAKIIPAGESGTKLQAWNDYEAAIPGIVSKYSGLGDKIEMVDMSTLLTLNTSDYYQSTPGGGYDSLHPSQTGYNKMADAWYPTLTARYQAIAGTTPPPINYFANCDVTVESSASCWTGIYSSTSKVTWVSGDGHDGTHSIRYTNPTSTTAATGVNAKPAPVTSTVPGVAFTGGVWARASQTGITITLGLREKRADNTAPGYALYSWTATDTNWHFISGGYTTKETGNSLTYSVFSPSLPSGAYVDSDTFSLTSPGQ